MREKPVHSPFFVKCFSFSHFTAFLAVPDLTNLKNPLGLCVARKSYIIINFL